MSTSSDTDEVHGGAADEPLIVEDLLCQIEVLRATGDGQTDIAGLWAQVDLLQGR